MTGYPNQSFDILFTYIQCRNMPNKQPVPIKMWNFRQKRLIETAGKSAGYNGDLFSWNK